MKKKYLIFIFLFSLCTNNKTMHADDLEFDALNLDDLEHITTDDMQTINNDQQTTFFDVLKTYQSWPTASKGWLDSNIETYPKSFLTGALFVLFASKNKLLILLTLYPLYKSGSTLYKQSTDNE